MLTYVHLVNDLSYHDIHRPALTPGFHNLVAHYTSVSVFDITTKIAMKHSDESPNTMTAPVCLET